MIKKPGRFSIVIATYTGVDTIDRTFQSLIEQQPAGTEYEVIVVIDGPNDLLRKKAERVGETFKKRGVDFKIKQFKQNKGRFEARLTAARIARYQQILIIDDRVTAPADYLKQLAASNQEIIMPDVIEKQANNFVSLTLHKLRQIIYGQKWGKDFKSFYIDRNNFESSPKGTTSLWINKNIFIKACAKLEKPGKNTKSVNEDTKILKNVVESGYKIYKSSRLKVEYQPRSSGVGELLHIYHRGPRFVDYYLMPGSRYFWLLVFFYISTVPALLIVCLWHVSVAFIIVGLLLASVWISSNLKNWLSIFFGLSSIVLFFGAGLWVGLIKKAIIR